MLWLIDACQIKVSADQYHMNISQAQVKSSSRWHVFFLKLTADMIRNWLFISQDCRLKPGYFILQVLHFQALLNLYVKSYVT